MNKEIRQALLQLTQLRKRVQKTHDTFDQLFAPLNNGKPSPLSWDELRQAEEALERQVPEFFVWFEPRHARYALIPKSDFEYAGAKGRKVSSIASSDANC